MVHGSWFMVHGSTMNYEQRTKNKKPALRSTLLLKVTQSFTENLRVTQSCSHSHNSKLLLCGPQFTTLLLCGPLLFSCLPLRNLFLSLKIFKYFFNDLKPCPAARISIDYVAAGFGKL
jgi:hypothetical protein